MLAKPDDQSAMRQALNGVVKLAADAAEASDTLAIRSRLLLVRLAVLDAYALAQSIEDHTRSEALQALERECA